MQSATETESSAHSVVPLNPSTWSSPNLCTSTVKSLTQKTCSVISGWSTTNRSPGRGSHRTPADRRARAVRTEITHPGCHAKHARAVWSALYGRVVLPPQRQERSGREVDLACG